MVNVKALKCKKILAALLALTVIVSALIIPQTQAEAVESVPTEMTHNVFLDALEYAGYDVQAQIEDGTIFKKYGVKDVPKSIRTNIDYSLNAVATGFETTSSGKPDIAYFEKYGLCCATYVNYVYFNYLPNVAKVDVSSLTKPFTNVYNVTGWEAAIRKWVDDGVGEFIDFTQNSDGSLNTEFDIPIGSIVIFKCPEYRYAHVAIYAGTYNGKHFVTHCGGDEGPVIQSIENIYESESVKLIVAPDMYNYIRLNKKKLTLGVGETYTLKASESATWKSSDSDVISVSGGKITAKSAGTATITAKSKSSSRSASCTITVKEAPESVALNKTRITLGVGETFDLNSSTPTGTASYNTTYKSSNSSIASVKSAGGLITAKKVGTTTITATTFNGETAECTVTVKSAPSSVSLNKTKITLGVGETYDLNSSLPKGTASYSIKYSTSDKKIATVKSAGGLITAKKVGTATITATTFNGETAKCTVTVKAAPSSVSLNKTKITLGVGETYDLDSTLPKDTASYSIKYSSDDKNVASVASSGGLVTANAPGTAVITATTFNGKKATCIVTVKEAPTELTLNSKKLKLSVGKTYDLNSSTNANSAAYHIYYTSSNSAVAKVTKSGGIVTALKKGTATITATAYNGVKTTCTVTVS